MQSVRVPEEATHERTAVEFVERVPARPLAAVRGGGDVVFNVRQVARETRRVLTQARRTGATIRDTDGTALVLVPQSVLGDVDLLCSSMATWMQVSQAVAQTARPPGAPALGDWIALEHRDGESLRTFLDECCDELYRAARTRDVERLAVFLESAGVLEGHQARIDRRRAGELERERQLDEQRLRAEQAAPVVVRRDAVSDELLVGLMAARAVLCEESSWWELQPEEEAAITRMWGRSPATGLPWWSEADLRSASLAPIRDQWLPGAHMPRWCPQIGASVRFRHGVVFSNDFFCRGPFTDIYDWARQTVLNTGGDGEPP